MPIGQAEAARSLGLRFDQVLTLVVLPQAVRMVIPPLINVFIALTKNTSVAGGFFVFELFSVGKRLANLHGSAVVPILLGIACFYLLITVPLGQLSHRLEPDGARPMSSSVLYDAPGPKTRRLSASCRSSACSRSGSALAWVVATLAAPRETQQGLVQPGLFDASRWNIFYKPFQGYGPSQVWYGIFSGLAATFGAATVAAVLAMSSGLVICLLRLAKRGGCECQPQ